VHDHLPISLQCIPKSIPYLHIISQRNAAASTPIAPRPNPAPPTAFATAPPVETPTVALAAAVLVLPPPPEENDAAAVLVISVVEMLLLAAPCVSESAAVDVVFHMNTLGWEVTTAGMEVTTLGMPVMMPTEFVSVVYEVKGLV
jgi:hypothetical protein